MTGNVWIDGGIIALLLGNQAAIYRASRKFNGSSEKIAEQEKEIAHLKEHGSVPVQIFMARFGEWEDRMVKRADDQSERMDALTEAFGEMTKMMQTMFRELPCATHGERLASLEAKVNGGKH